MSEGPTLHDGFREIVAERLGAYALAVKAEDEEAMVGIATDIVNMHQRLLDEIDTLNKIIAAKKDLPPAREH